MHEGAYDWVARQAKRLGPFVGEKVVEFGSKNVNGSVRPLFVGSSYWGLDLLPGHGVDQIINVKHWDGNGQWDVVVSTEAMEHYPLPGLFTISARRALRPGGYFIATMAAPERQPHGNDGGEVGEDEWYRGLSETELREMLEHGWNILDLEHHPERGDLYVTAVKE